ncbi:MAG TPA: GNAT family N-acetyltransferase [Pyrinomonadaceae bacterium]|nr:GNAT family N-acetyltransferase [Pyrinomonadaceae bacterium]
MKPEPTQTGTSKLDIAVRALEENDLDAADHIMRLAFGTFIGLPEPAAFMGDADYVHTRWRANPLAAFAAEVDGQLAGSNFATQWGSVGFFGPLTIHPQFWDRGVGKRLMEPIIDLFSKWNTTHAGLFTFSQSQKHVGLYQRFGFWPRFLTMLMAKPVEGKQGSSRWTTFSETRADRAETLKACHELTDAIYAGLDLTGEIEAVRHQNLGETILVWRDDELAGFAVCHSGPGTEAGSGTCYVKFAAARSDAKADHNFNSLLEAVERWAATRSLERIVAGVNSARHNAYRQMLARGFVTQIQGVVMSRPNEAGYNRPDVYLIDDWR